jgi:Rieske Fe-S protein
MPVTPESTEPTVSRRDFLDLLWKGLLGLGGLLGLAALARFLDYSTEPPRQTVFDLGPAEGYAPGSRTLLPDAQAVLVRTESGFQAFSTVCPHLGCTVEPATDGFVCRCHASRFGPQGALLQGPATKPLRALRVEVAADGHVVLHTDQDAG